MAAWGVFADALEIRAGRKTASRGHSSAINVTYRRQKGRIGPLYVIYGNTIVVG